MSQQDAIFASGASKISDGHLRHRKPVQGEDSKELDEIIDQTKSLSIKDSKTKYDRGKVFVYVISPLILTAVSAWVRLYKIGQNNKVVWDEAHFGKFGSHYLKHEFYFDVHPPLGKLLVGLSGYLAGYDGSFEFKSGNSYTPEVNYFAMRVFNCIFGILCTPFAYFTAVSLGFSQWSVWFISLLVVFEMLSLTLSKFILLDSMLLLFTVTVFFGLLKVHSCRQSQGLLSKWGFFWLVFTGISIGCVCSVKWVGLFVTALVGFYTIYDLLIDFYRVTAPRSSPDVRIKWSQYLCHWATRIITLIIIPLIIYVTAFKVHFHVLDSSGPGDGSISTLLQASLKGNTLKNGPRSAAFGSLVTLRSQGLSPNLLHSHPHLYPEGSRQQQITTYGFKDENNEFLIEFDLASSKAGRFATLEYDEESPDLKLDYHTLVKDGDIIRLMHREHGCFLHSHSIPAPVLKTQYETSCYGNIDVHDEKDDWVVEIQTQDISPSPEFQNESRSELHPISTNFRLRHKILGCYLATTGFSYPAWGYQQGEVVCKNAYFAQDKSTWWNIEDHVNPKLPSPELSFVAPKPKFWKEFILLNYGMMASNNALIPDTDHFDHIASRWWEWPILRNGLRMSGWYSEEPKYFLMGNPFVTYLTTACIPISVLLITWKFFQWQRQNIEFDVFGKQWNDLIAQGLFPLLGYVLHYFPFIIMGRVTYLHHYVPAIYFAIYAAAFILETLVVKSLHSYAVCTIYSCLYFGIVASFWHFRHFALGMVGSAANFLYLKLLSTWRVA